MTTFKVNPINFVNLSMVIVPVTTVSTDTVVILLLRLEIVPEEAL